MSAVGPDQNESHRSAGGTVRVGAPHILIVDDNAALGALLAQTITERGNRVTSAVNGASMRDLLGREHFDVVVVDVRFSGEEGRLLALDAKELRLPVVLMSGSDERIDFAQRYGLPLLRKSFRIGQLFVAMDAALASGGHGPRDA